MTPSLKPASTTDPGPTFSSASVVLVLDAPSQPVAPGNLLPRNFRSMNAVPGIVGGRASGSAQFSGTEIQNMLAKVQRPLTIVDLRQEPHGFLTINPPLGGETDIPTTDHCRPRDSEVDRFVSFEKSLAADMWLHVHCRGGDGRTTTFMAMHDMIHNAPQDSLQAILARQGPHGIGGVDLTKTGNPVSFEFPFAAERSTFVQDFYCYVCEAKPNQFALTWSDWVRQRNMGT